MEDTEGLREQAQFARWLASSAKSAIHPRQLDTLHEVFTPTTSQIEWATSVLNIRHRRPRSPPTAHRGIGGLRVADRARRLLQIAADRTAPVATSQAPR